MRDSVYGVLVVSFLAASHLVAQQVGIISAPHATFMAIDTGETVLVQDADGSVRCRLPYGGESAHFDRLDVPLQVISTATQRTPNAGGLTIQLRATAQLDGFPAAKAAFIRAANTWQSLLTTQTTPVTIIIDVDFGTTRFGQPYPEGVLGSAGSQDVGDTSGIPTLAPGSSPTHPRHRSRRSSRCFQAELFQPTKVRPRVSSELPRHFEQSVCSVP